MNITKQTVSNMDACVSGVSRFHSAFPEGVDPTTVTEKQVASALRKGVQIDWYLKRKLSQSYNAINAALDKVKERRVSIPKDAQASLKAARSALDKQRHELRKQERAVEQEIYRAFRDAYQAIDSGHTRLDRLEESLTDKVNAAVNKEMYQKRAKALMPFIRQLGNGR